MLTFIRRLFEILKRFDSIMKKPIIYDYSIGFITTIIWLFTLMIGWTLRTYESWKWLSTLLCFVSSVYIFLFIVYLYLAYDKPKKYVLWGEKKSRIAIWKEFTDSSYVRTLLFFCCLIPIPIIGICVSMNILFNSNIAEYALDKIYEISMFVLLITNIFWFSYHVLKKTVAIEIIKLKLNFYALIGATITFLISITNKNPMLLLSVLALSYSWTLYIIEEAIVETKSNTISDENLN